MKRRNIRRNKNKGAPKWMVTYSDMVTLILVFFILLFSMSQIDSVKFEAISESFRNRMIFDFYPSPVPMENPTEHTRDEESGKNSNEFENPTQLENKTDDDDTTRQDSLDNLMENVDQYLDENELNSVISATRTDQGVVLVLQESILFDSGEAEILASGKPFLSKIASMLDSLPNNVKVEGHTDDRPIDSFRYPSNWELSGARASSVIRYMIEENKFDESRFSSVGYGDTRPLVENTSEENWAKNRRVEIVILEESQGDDE
ncbi:Chemotaxis protein MotB [Oceanobacillus picturae]|jgi:chemotaxis protein MotB|uniref:Chemotaxis protein MotB n=1 Tax=Oceanobacillus picturae TaxID=171693 RepID=W9A753_9BACI|nr:flagellar motor protein MotS [Oceanobacillus picturae]CDO01594.1 Chemotaxis protein MotB [Oceanobacillus picturae]